ncbi:MAG: glycosyltransferase [Gaiellaceae bacterium]|jgi:glycosyltransferase involved in cell wall biosynthesis
MTGLRKTVVAAVSPLASGAAHFNGSMVRAMAATSPVDVVSWRRMYPPLLYRGQRVDESSPDSPGPDASFILDWHDPRTWRRAVRRVDEFQSEAVILPWLHPVLTPPYRYMLRHVPKATTRVVICHNVAPHEPVPGYRRLSRAALKHADLLVTHAPHQRGELVSLGLASTPVLEAFHPRFDAQELAPGPSDHERAAERARHGNPDLLLLTFGSIRPYKGVDLALDALARVDRSLRVRLVVAGRSWGCGDELRAQAERLELNGRVEFCERFVSNEEAALLFTAADASLLPYRSASQSGVVQLSFAYGRPVIATRVGGLPAAVDDQVDGILCEPDAAALAAAIERTARDHTRLAAGVQVRTSAHSFHRYCELLDDAVAALRQ